MKISLILNAKADVYAVCVLLMKLAKATSSDDERHNCGQLGTDLVELFMR